ncbi:hypothetical protein [Chitinophaga rhizophila]|uniref:HEXXH motif-containing protein n=1 Tax=Chitinophaga rhizophila TaxID=2866212 RepID=A0ABS7GJT8_9BACT|nr:hypothetical protein [Chitinophaga rhizophila]MBW8687982.1 hypothetical protein [Chitinophaga rhizophila]
MNYYEKFDDHLGAVVDSVKKLLYARHKDIFQRLDFYNDSIYMEPLLYTYLQQQDDKWLDSIIYGYEQSRKPVIVVFPNSQGIIYLPNVGYLRTSFSGHSLLLHTAGDVMTLLDGEIEMPFTFEPLLYSEHGIEIVIDHHPLLLNVFTEQGNRPEDIQVSGLHIQHLESFNKGMHIIEELNPGHFGLLLKNLKKVMLFNATQQNSFAVLSAHNMIFLCVNPWDDEIFFADHISHEGAHVTYFTLTYETKQQLFTVNCNTPLGDLVGNPGHYPSIYLFFHGMFTFVEITKTLQGCIDREGLTHMQQHDVKGRFIFHMQRFKLSLDMFEELNLFKEEGAAWYTLFKAQYEAFEEQYLALLPQYNLTGQPYDFNSKVFAEINASVI